MTELKQPMDECGSWCFDDWQYCPVWVESRRAYVKNRIRRGLKT